MTWLNNYIASGVLSFFPKCDSNGESLVVLCLHIRSWYRIDFNAALMVNESNSLSASFIHAKRYLIALINLSTKSMIVCFYDLSTMIFLLNLSTAL